MGENEINLPTTVSDEANRLDDAVTTQNPLRYPFQSFWAEVVLRVCLLEALWPSVLLAWQLVEWDVTQLDDSSVLSELILTWAFGSVVFGYLCLIVTGLLASIVALSGNYLATKLGFQTENFPLGILFGGFIGLMMTIGFAPWIGELASSSLWIMGSATVLGQIGGYLGARNALRLRKSVNAHLVIAPSSFRISIKQALMLTAIAAMLLAFLKRSGMLSPPFITFLAVWIALQAGGLGAYFLSQRVRSIWNDRST